VHTPEFPPHTIRSVISCFWLVLDLVLVFVCFGLFQICSHLPFSPHSKDHVLQRGIKRDQIDKGLLRSHHDRVIAPWPGHTFYLFLSFAFFIIYPALSRISYIYTMDTLVSTSVHVIKTEVSHLYYTYITYH
jgi:hypothetical protein